ncbi:MAG: NAD(P)/FAD-dependent oxidoreductase [Vicinamibacterales bacterium]
MSRLNQHVWSDGIYDVIVIGAGPAGAVAGRLLASWGHSVLVLGRDLDRARGLAESLPPSSAKILSAVGALDAVERSGFPRGAGNAVWWGERRAGFAAYADDGHGFQVFRPDLDALLQRLAIEAGACLVSDASVLRIRPAGDDHAVDVRVGGERRTARGRRLIDASGRAGVIGRRYRSYESAFRMQALIGVWRRAGGWDLPDDSCTVVETCEDGWAWSIPVASDVRHLVVMVDGTVSALPRGRTLEATYRAALAKSRQVEALSLGATLTRTWACDASVYGSSTYAGPSFVLVGDAAATIDPLSSFGVKKALASAWLGSIAVHTGLANPSCRSAALEFFAAREREMFAAHLRQSRDFAREALACHPHSFWARRAAVGCDAPVEDEALVHADDVRAALAAIRAVDPGGLSLGSIALERLPLIRGHQIVLEPALRIPGHPRPVRYCAGVDLVGLIELAREGADVPGLFDAYTHRVAPVPLPSFLQTLSLLIARGLLHARPRVA